MAACIGNAAPFWGAGRTPLEAAMYGGAGLLLGVEGAAVYGTSQSRIRAKYGPILALVIAAERRLEGRTVRLSLGRRVRSEGDHPFRRQRLRRSR